MKTEYVKTMCDKCGIDQFVKKGTKIGKCEVCEELFYVEEKE